MHKAFGGNFYAPMSAFEAYVRYHKLQKKFKL